MILSARSGALDPDSIADVSREPEKRGADWLRFGFLQRGASPHDLVKPGDRASDASGRSAAAPSRAQASDDVFECSPDARPAIFELAEVGTTSELNHDRVEHIRGDPVPGATVRMVQVPRWR